MISLVIILMCHIVAIQQPPIYPWSDRLEPKIMAVLESAHPSGEIEISVIPGLNKQLNENEFPLSERLFELINGDVNVGYLYVGRAPSMKNVFDFMLLLDSNYNITKAKVLIYREQHGRQIGSARWLSQFVNLSSQNPPIFEQNIDGISGATISTRNMTTAVNAVLEEISVARNKGLLK